MIDAKFEYDILVGPPQRIAVGRGLVLLGLMLLLLGLSVIALGWLLLADADSASSDFVTTDAMYIAVWTVTLLLWLVCLYGGVALIGRGRRMQAPTAQQMLANDTRRPVLFLRSFSDDDLVDPTPRLIPLGDFFPRRYEESLARPLASVGPMLSIGRPGNRLALLGGARLFVPDHAWQDAVNDLRERSAAVVVMVGHTDGLWWEIETSLRTVERERLLFFFPFVEQEQRRRSVWQRVFSVHPARMPFSGAAHRRMEAERQARYMLFRERMPPPLAASLPQALGRSQFIDFLPSGEPRVLPTVRPWWWPIALYAPSTARMIIDLPRTLKPFMKKLQAASCMHK